MKSIAILMAVVALFSATALAKNPNQYSGQKIACFKGKDKYGNCKRSLRVRDADTNEFYEIPNAGEASWV